MQFIIALTEHRVLGYVFAPYLVKIEKDGANLKIYDRVTDQSLKTYEELLSPEQIQLVKYIENYNYQNLFKLFSKKKKQNPRDFIENIPTDYFAEHVRPYIEKQIGKCLEVMEYNPVSVYHKLLQDKLYESDKVEIIDSECDVILNFIRNENGIQYRLTIQQVDNELLLLGKTAIVFSNEPCCVAIDNKLFVFKEIDSKKILPFLDKEYINIPKQAEIKYLQTFVRAAIAKYKVRADGFKIREIGTTPKSVVSLEKNLQGQLSLVLKFVYNANSVYYANRRSGKKVNCEFKGDEVEFICVNRNYTIENEFISLLLSFGLINKDGPYFEPIEKKGGDSGIYGAVTWLNFNKNLLSKNGYEVAQSNLDKNYYIDNLQLRIEVSDKTNDWFDILANVEFDGFVIPFVEFKEHIVQGIREFVLPNNKVLILPEEWFESYSDLMNFSSNNGNYLKLNSQHFSLLNNSVGKISDNFRDNLKQLLLAGKDEQEIIPKAVQAELREYQQEGYTWMYRLYQNRFGGCLADDMGLGKTLQTLTLLKRIVNENAVDNKTHDSFKKDLQIDLFTSATSQQNSKQTKTSLIVVPTSLIHNWINEIDKFVPELTVLAYSGQNRGKLEDYIDKCDVLITSYGLLRNDLNQFEKISFLYTILDESQVIKNPGSKTYAAVMSLKTDYRLVLTGTPIENSLSDLWAQFNFLNPGLLGNLGFFQSEFQFPIEKSQDENKRDRLRQLIAPFMLRRTKSQVAKELPSLTEQIIQCDLNEVQESLYEREKSKARKLVMENINRMGLKGATMHILQSLMRLRQIANHPVLYDENYIAGSGKFEEVTRNLTNLHSEGHKALIFSSFVKHLDLFANWLDEQNIGYTKLTGETTKREKVVEEFQTNPDCSFFLVSLKAGGVGLNLTAASYVLMLDPWWNPAAEKQAINRAHRIGQDKQVMVYRFITQNTLEEKILKLQARKTELADIFVNENAFKHITEEEILDLFE
jgi:SNF2 family DNA or RNA helicase